MARDTHENVPGKRRQGNMQRKTTSSRASSSRSSSSRGASSGRQASQGASSRGASRSAGSRSTSSRDASSSGSAGSRSTSARSSSARATSSRSTTHNGSHREPSQASSGGSASRTSAQREAQASARGRQPSPRSGQLASGTAGKQGLPSLLSHLPSLPTRSQPSKRRGPSNRDWLLLMFFCILAIVLVGKLVYVQVFKSAEYSEAAKEVRTSDVTISARRGTIYDRNGKVLATTVDAVTIYANPSEISDPQGTADKICAILGGDSSTLVQKLSSDTSTFAYVYRKADKDLASQVEALELPGIYFLDDSKRVYPYGSTAAQVIGLVGTDDTGLAGLELEYDDELSGTDGELIYERGRNGIPITDGVTREVSAIDGKDIVISLDLELQQYVESLLAEAIPDTGSSSGSITVYDGATGEVYACASYPLPDSSAEGALNLAPAVDAYEPGSVFKAVTASACIDTGTLTADSSFDIPNELPVADAVITDAEDHGDVTWTLAEIISESSNIGIDLAERTIGNETLYSYIQRYHFGEDCGIDFPGASSGLVPPVEEWDAVTAQNIPFGQGLTLSTFQILRLYGAFANNGVMETPHFLMSYPNDKESDVSWGSEQVMQASTATTLTNMFELAVEAGTATNAQVPGYTVAGKTATAEYVEGGVYVRDSYNTSFIAYLPNTNSKLVIDVVLNKPNGQSELAAAYGGKLLTYMADHYKLSPA